MENIEFFISEKNAAQEANQKEEKIIKKDYNLEDTNDNFFQQPTAPGQSTNFDPQSTLNNFNITKTTLTNKPIIMTTTSNNDLEKTKKRFFSRGSTPKIKIFDDIKIPSENLSNNKDDSMNAPTEKEQNVNQNKIIPGFSQENESLFDDLSNSNEIIKNYNDYLNWLNKKFDKFFLCYNKEQFKAVMAEKGIKVQEHREGYRNKGQPNERQAEKRQTKKRRTKRFDGIGYTTKTHIDAAINNKENAKVEGNEIEDNEDDDIPAEHKTGENEYAKLRKKENKPSNDIFLRFLEEQENKTNEYIHERELRLKKK